MPIELPPWFPTASLRPTNLGSAPAAAALSAADEGLPLRWPGLPVAPVGAAAGREVTGERNWMDSLKDGSPPAAVAEGGRLEVTSRGLSAGVDG